MFIQILVDCNDATGKVITVDDDKPADHSSIQDAIDASKDGWTILVSNGIYYENIIIDKEITITGEDSSSTIIHGQHNGNGVDLSSHNINISNFTITKCREGFYAGIKVSSNNNNVSNIICTNNAGYGLYMKDARNNRINYLNSSFNDGDGFHLDDSHDNVIINSSGISNNYGIQFVDSNWNSIHSNYFSNNSYGIFVQFSENNTLENNYAVNNRNHGIWIQLCDNTSMIGNTCCENEEKGIFNQWSDFASIIGNKANNNGESGLHFLASHNCIIENNIVGENGYHAAGISVASCINGTIKGNIMIDNGLYIGTHSQLYYSTHDFDNTNLVNGNPIYFINDQDGFIVPQDAGSVIIVNSTNGIIRNTDLRFGTTSLIIAYSSNISLLNLDCSNNTYHGIEISFSDNITIEDCTINNNGYNGLSTFYNDNISIVNSIIVNNSYFGLTCGGGIGLLIRSCTFKNNQYGAQLSSYENTSLENNSFNYNQLYGIMLFSMVDCFLLNSKIADNMAGIWINSAENILAKYNDIYNNTIGLYLTGSVININFTVNSIFSNREIGINASETPDHMINARYNWWGQSSGPYHPQGNAQGIGDNVTDNVIFTPWLESIYINAIIWIDSPIQDTINEGDYLNFSSHVISTVNISKYSWHSSLDSLLYYGHSSHFTINTLTPGHHSISLRVLDESGEWSSPLSSEVTVNGRPIASIGSISPNPSTIGLVIDFWGIGIDDGIIINGTWTSSIDGQIHSGSELNFSSQNLSIGNHIITFKVLDNNYLWSEDIQSTITIMEKPSDSDPPNITIISHVNRQRVNGIVNISGSASDNSAIVRVEYRLFGVGDWENASGTSSWSFMFDTTQLIDGDYIIEVRSYDGIQFSAIQTISVEVLNKKTTNDSDSDSSFVDDYLSMPFIGLISISILLIICGIAVILKRNPRPNNNLVDYNKQIKPVNDQLIPPPPLVVNQVSSQQQTPEIPNIPVTSGTWQCPQCNTIVNDQYSFCMNCGIKR